MRLAWSVNKSLNNFEDEQAQKCQHKNELISYFYSIIEVVPHQKQKAFLALFVVFLSIIHHISFQVVTSQNRKF